MAAQGPLPFLGPCASSLEGFQKRRDVKSSCLLGLVRDTGRPTTSRARKLRCEHRKEGELESFGFLGSVFAETRRSWQCGSRGVQQQALYGPGHCRSSAFPSGDAKAVGPALSLLSSGMGSWSPFAQGCVTAIVQKVPLKPRASHCPLSDSSTLSQTTPSVFSEGPYLELVFPAAAHSQVLKQPQKGTVLKARGGQKSLCPSHKCFLLPFPQGEKGPHGLPVEVQSIGLLHPSSCPGGELLACVSR